MYIEHMISKGQLIQLSFGQAAAGASQTGVALTANGVASNITGIPMPWNYDIVGVSFDLSAAGSAGVLTVAPTIGGTAQTTYLLAAGAAASGTIRIPRGAAGFHGLAGDVIGAKVTTDGSWNGTTSKLGVVVWVLAHLGGI